MGSPSASARRRIAGVFLFALAVNFIWLAVDRELYSDDSPTYTGPARSLVEGRGFQNSNGIPETRRTPGYPLFLAPFLLIANGFVIATVVQAILNAALAALVAWFLARRGEVASGIAAGAMFAIDLTSLHYAAQILTETLFTVVLLAAVLLVMRRNAGFVALAGLLAGASVLVRPISFFIVVPIAFVLLVQRRVVHAIVFCVLFAVAPAAWMQRNAALEAGRTVSTITSWSVLFDRAAGTLAVARPGAFDRNVIDVRNDFARTLGESEAATYSNHVERPGDHFRTDQYSPLAMRVLRGHPVEYARVWVRGVARTMFGGGARMLNDFFGVPVTLAHGLVLLYTVPLAVFALIGLWRWFLLDRESALMCAAVIAYLLVTCSVAEPSARFRVPMMPYLAIAFGLGVTRWRRSPPATR